MVTHPYWAPFRQHHAIQLFENDLLAVVKFWPHNGFESRPWQTDHSSFVENPGKRHWMNPSNVAGCCQILTNPLPKVEELQRKGTQWHDSSTLAEFPLWDLLQAPLSIQCWLDRTEWDQNRASLALCLLVFQGLLPPMQKLAFLCNNILTQVQRRGSCKAKLSCHFASVRV